MSSRRLAAAEKARKARETQVAMAAQEAQSADAIRGHKAEIDRLMAGLSSESTVEPLYAERFNSDATSNCIVGARVPKQSVEFLRDRQAATIAQSAQATAAVYTTESARINARERAARTRAKDGLVHSRRTVAAKADRMREASGAADARLAAAFRAAGANLGDALARCSPPLALAFALCSAPLRRPPFLLKLCCLPRLPHP
eukprot:SAG22_NODE_1436_length_4421_cov_9.840583_1_plen_201_part_00